MITEDDLVDAGLASKEPAQQFRFIEQLAMKRLREFYPNEEPIYDDYDYMGSVLAAAQAFGISDLANWEMPSRSGDWQGICRQFRAEATLVSQRILFKQAAQTSDDPNTVALTPKLKRTLKFHIEQIRSAIDAEPIEAWRKEELYEALSNLEREIDKARTRLSSVFEVVGKFWEGDVKLPDLLRQIVITIQQAKSAEREAPILSAPRTPKRISGPKAAEPDEIPF